MMVGVFILIALTAALVGYIASNEITSNRIRQSNELIKIYQKQIADLSLEVKTKAFIHVPIVQREDMAAYHTKLSGLSEDPLFLFYFAQLKKSTVDGFGRNGKDLSEFYRGMLTMIDTIQSDSRQARAQIAGGGNEV